MARINIEDSLFTDERFLQLIEKTGCSTKALGLVVKAFILAQKCYLDESNERLIPVSKWSVNKDFALLVEVGLAEISINGIYVIGSNEQFSWLIQRSKAGKKSAKMKAESTQKSVERPLNDRSVPLNGSQPLTLTHSLSLTLKNNTQDNSNELSSRLTQRKRSPGTLAISRQTFSISTSEEILSTVDLRVKENWVALYEENYVNRELLKIANYLVGNPAKNKKTKRGLTQFVSNWLDRGWQKHQAGIAGQSTPKFLTVEDVEKA